MMTPFTESGGRPGRDFHRQNRRNPWWCQRIKVWAWTMIKARRQLNQRASQTSVRRVAGVTRFG